jgi:hypothetical protein
MRQASIWAAAGAAVTAVAAVAIVVGTFWNDLGASEMSSAGWVALGLGVVVTLALGVGLMSLMFISSRRGYDDPGGHKDC